MNWDAYLKEIDVHDIKYVIVGQPEFFKRANELVHSVSRRRLANVSALALWHIRCRHI